MSRDGTSSTAPTITEWFYPDRFQIICAGLDGLYGAISEDAGGSSPPTPVLGTVVAAPHVPGPPTSYNLVGQGHFDNITNMGVIEDIP
jgi:hypothetical protein